MLAVSDDSRHQASIAALPTADDKARVRTEVFHHLAGLALAPTVKALADHGILQRLQAAEHPVLLSDLAGRTRANAGYLRVALRLLASAGWLEEEAHENRRVFGYRPTAAGRSALRIGPALYDGAVTFIPGARRMAHLLFGASDALSQVALRCMVDRLTNNWSVDTAMPAPADAVTRQIHRHLDGMVIGPAMVALSQAGVLARLERGPVRLDAIGGHRAALDGIFEALAACGWATRGSGEAEDEIALTPAGQYASRIATSYGVTVSYLPTFEALPTLLFGNPNVPRVDDTGIETLVDRGINVWGSGGAHSTYFSRVDEIVVEIFNRPIDEQPRGICDMGCGDGTFLAHLYSVVAARTRRGQMLDEHPLFIVGADFNKVARQATSRTFRQARIPNAMVIPADINRPAHLANELEKRGLDSHDLLHIRSFLDHNRPYSRPSGYKPGARTANSTGAFAYRGELVFADELEENLVRHLARWKPYIGRFGLLVLELHTLPPHVAAAHVNRTPAVAYDGTHGYSDQYLVELPVFLECAREAGLQADPRFQARFPPSDLATVSINFFTAAQQAGRT